MQLKKYFNKTYKQKKAPNFATSSDISYKRVKMS